MRLVLHAPKSLYKKEKCLAYSVTHKIPSLKLRSDYFCYNRHCTDGRTPREKLMTTYIAGGGRWGLK